VSVRILHDKNLEHVEVLLDSDDDKTSQPGSLTAFTLEGTRLTDGWETDKNSPSVVVLHTPGHSPGSITLYRRPSENHDGILFTGDTYAYTTRGDGYMSGFPRYGNNLKQQAQTLQALLPLDWKLIAAGHGHARDYRGIDDQVRADEMQVAIQELRQW